MKQFVLYVQDGSAVNAFVDLNNQGMNYGRLFYSHDQQNWTLILNGISGMTDSGCIINVPEAVTTGVPHVWLYIETAPVNNESAYTRAAEGIVHVSPATADPGGGGASGNVTVTNFPTAYPLSTAQYNAIVAELQTIVSNTMAGSDALTNTELRAAPVNVALSDDVNVGNLPVDAFSNLIVGERDNQIEVHFDDTNYANYLTHTTTGGGQGGSRSQANGQVSYFTGTATNGAIKAVTLDIVKYRPLHESYAAWTAAFKSAGVANSWQRMGLFNDTDGVFIGYEGTTFGITWRNNGSAQQIPQSSWIDKCDGSVGSRFTRNGTPEALNPAALNIYRVRYGWLGAAGFVVEIFTPDWEWIPVYILKRPNVSSLPFLANADLAMAIDIGKASGTTNFEVVTSCWAGGTTSGKGRLSDPITERSLVENVRSVITGKTTAGGGGYVDVKVTGSGALAADVTGSTVVATATDLDIRNLSVLLDSVTQTLRPSTPYSQPVTGPVTDQVLVSVNPGQRIRLIRNAGHIDPAATDVYPNITLKIGSTTVFRDKMEPGLPWSETVCFEGADGADLTISIDATVAVYLNMRYEVF